MQLSVSEGDVVEAKDEVGTIINRDYMSASVEIVENDVHKLKKGQIVKFTFPAYEDLEVTGYVDSFPAVGRITSRGATVVDAAKVKAAEDRLNAILAKYDLYTYPEEPSKFDIFLDDSMKNLSKFLVSWLGGGNLIDWVLSPVTKLFK